MSRKKTKTDLVVVVTQDDAPSFTPPELLELNKYIAENPTPNTLTPENASKFFSLYLEGRKIEDIRKQFPAVTAGVLLYNRYYYKWDIQKQQQFNELAMKVRERLAKCQADTANHLMDKLAIVNKEFAQAMEIYLHNPIKENLPESRITSTKELKETIEILKEIIHLSQAPDGGKQGQPSITVNVNTGEGTKVEITPAEHSAILKELIEAKK